MLRRKAVWMVFKKRIIIGGLPRSGSTLLRFLLDSSKDIIAGPETRFFLEPLYRHHLLEEKNSSTSQTLLNKLGIDKDKSIDIMHAAKHSIGAFDEIMREYAKAARVTKAAWAEKTPANCFHYHRLAAEDNNLYFISTVRNGLDVITSKRDEESKDYWCSVQRYNDTMRSIYSCTHNRHFILRYEQLVEFPEATLRSLFDFLGLFFEDKILEEYNKESMTRDLTKVNQPKLVNPIEKTWVNRYKDEKHKERVEEFLDNEEAVHWHTYSGYTLPE
ncbi:Sulfotransferase family protein [Tindallia magadiensis]|uniref:Sulfotransferase family protein n=1 Tax=Tindallia magadiensis TaxID=69895 RepID=A0A1I3D3R0_9FIRM|nr:sulfotransferase [Tindallia magadiensis]SFH81380.1 Sulfotransferase family protein [Tindallia magadiensis]